jgi:gamma-glutamyl hercynylcysteine S-oxide synthase
VLDTEARNAELRTWLADIKALRSAAKDRYGVDGADYGRPEFKWTQSSFVQPQVMVQDRYLYDPKNGKYTVGRFLDDVNTRYGGIDSVLIWPGYPNLGIDNRNLNDLIDDLPGGKAGVRGMVEEFHQAGIHVLFPVFTWDQGTRSPGMPAWDAISQILADIDADGINGDTLDGLPRTYRVASDRLNHPLVLEPEGGLGGSLNFDPSYPRGADEMLSYNTMTWGYWNYDFVPSISRYKWIETRHMVHICERFSRDHTVALQAAFFNGIGFESWENVWGIWNGMTAHDGEVLRRVATLERHFASLLTSVEWIPHTPTEQFGVFASQWPSHDERLWTIINRNHYTVSGRQIVVPMRSSSRFFDLWHGVELQPIARGDAMELSFELEPDGFGAILETTNPAPSLFPLLKLMAGYAARPLDQFSREWTPLRQRAVPIQESNVAEAATKGMVRVPAGDFIFKVEGTEIEGGDDAGVDVQYEWEDSPRRHHMEPMHIHAFWIDEYPVTNREFRMFLQASGYRPADSHNFLRDWSQGTYPNGWDNKPVTWVSLEDARAYARWAHKRLPHEWEWQYSAQGTDGRTYPWGNAWFPDAAPKPDQGRDMLPPSDVNQHPAGASPFGIMDMVGNVWQWTDEYIDDHTRAAILRGGSHYLPAYSNYSYWYFPQAKELYKHSKYLLMAPSIDRSATIGFRCVKDIDAGEMGRQAGDSQGSASTN